MSTGSGDRNEYVEIQRETRTRVPGGSFTSAWAAVGNVWADVQWIGESESQRFGSIRVLRKYRFNVNAMDAQGLAITSGDRILWNGDIYNIEERPRFQAPQLDTNIIAESGVTQ